MMARAGSAGKAMWKAVCRRGRKGAAAIHGRCRAPRGIFAFVGMAVPETRLFPHQLVRKGLPMTMR